MPRYTPDGRQLKNVLYISIRPASLPGCPAILVFQLFPSFFNVLVILRFLQRILPRTSKHREYRNSTNFAVNIRTPQLLPQFFEQNSRAESSGMPQTSNGCKLKNVQLYVPFYSYFCSLGFCMQSLGQKKKYNSFRSPRVPLPNLRVNVLFYF